MVENPGDPSRGNASACVGTDARALQRPFFDAICVSGETVYPIKKIDRPIGKINERPCRAGLPGCKAGGLYLLPIDMADRFCPNSFLRECGRRVVSGARGAKRLLQIRFAPHNGVSA